MLELSHLKEGAYIFQLTVTDTVGQRSSDNVSVSVLPRIYSTGGEKKVLPLSSPQPATAQLFLEGWRLWDFTSR